MKSFDFETNKKNLLITTVGNRALSTCRHWSLGEKSYDIMLIYYDTGDGSQFEDLAKYFIVQSGFKYPSIFKVLYDYPTLIDSYDFFFLPDDDVEMDTNSINSLFDFAYKRNTAICQPSLIPLKYNWEITVNNPYTEYRYVKMVEVMCPLFAKDALQKCLPTFIESQSGWGLEPVWAKLLGNPRRSIAIYDGVKATHLNASDQINGNLYLALHEQGINQNDELTSLLGKYDATLDFTETWAVYRDRFHQKLHQLISEVLERDDIDEIMLVAFCLNMVLIRILITYHSGDLNKLLRLYNFDPLYDKSKSDDFKVIESLFKDNKDMILELTDKIMARQKSINPAYIKKWLALCEREIKKRIKSSHHGEDLFSSFFGETTYIIRRQLKLSSNLEIVLLYFIKKALSHLISKKQLKIS